MPILWLPPAEYARKFLDIADESVEEESPETNSESDDTEEVDVAELDGSEGTLLELSDQQFNELLRSAARLPPDRAPATR